MIPENNNQSTPPVNQAGPRPELPFATPPEITPDTMGTPPEALPKNPEMQPNVQRPEVPLTETKKPEIPSFNNPNVVNEPITGAEKNQGMVSSQPPVMGQENVNSTPSLESMMSAHKTGISDPHEAVNLHGQVTGNGVEEKEVR